MEGSVPSPNAGDIDGKYRLSFDRSQASENASTCLNCEETAKLEQLKVPHHSSSSETNDNAVEEVETPDLCPDFGCQSSVSAVVSVENDRVYEKKQKGLTRRATFPSSPACSRSASSSANEKQCSASDNGYARSVSLPASFKLVSALKGSRCAQNAASLNATLRVKWAPDVYDPPATSLSHTVNKSSHQRPKAKKANKRNKHNRGKSSRGSSSARRNGGHSSICIVAEPVDQRLHAVEDDLLPRGYSESEGETLDFVGKNDSKCGSSFMREALAKMHISVGEAL